MAFFESIGMKAYFLPQNQCGYIGSKIFHSGNLSDLRTAFKELFRTNN